jgi:hypothetical protein
MVIQQGPISLRFRMKSSRAPEVVPKMWLKVRPDGSRGRAGWVKGYTTFRYVASAGTSATSKAYWRVTSLEANSVTPCFLR